MRVGSARVLGGGGWQRCRRGMGESGPTTVDGRCGMAGEVLGGVVRAGGVWTMDPPGRGVPGMALGAVNPRMRLETVVVDRVVLHVGEIRRTSHGTAVQTATLEAVHGRTSRGSEVREVVL